MRRPAPVVILALALFASVVASTAFARGQRARSQSAVSVAPVETHDLLTAEEEGLVTVKYIPANARSARIVVTNRSGRPLSLRLPAAFAGVPVLAQLGMGMGMGMGGPPNNGNAGFGAANAPQATGGGPPNAGMNIGAPPGGAFSLPPEKTRVVQVTTVCLEHGRPEPSPARPYKLVELGSYSNDPRLAALLQSVGRGEVSQKVAQAAAWHIANGLTWEQLAAEKIDHAGGVPDEPFFTPAELQAAFLVVDIVTKRAAAAPGSTASGR